MMPYFSNSNHTGLCQTNEVISKINNLTASYAYAAGDEELMMMVCGPIIMFILIALFLRGTLDARAVLGPNLRILLSSALALFLPVMSYLFSEDKDAAGGRQRSTASADDDVSVRARVILTWMLLVELLRKKVDEMRMWGSYSSSIQRAGRVVWLGSLVYFNISSPGRKAVFSVLWILCATKLLLRIIFTEVEKRSYPDKSWLISSYMPQMLEVERELEQAVEVEPPVVVAHELLCRCNYIVMGEEKLAEGQVTADGYELTNLNNTDDDGIVTVGKIWWLVDANNHIFGVFDRNESTWRVCLSFALFKLLRRRFEHHSVVPVVLASPMFLLVNYFLVPVAVFLLCLIAVAICGNGDVSHALSSIRADNYALQPGFAKLAVCTVVRAVHFHSLPAFLFTIDLLITLLLFIIFLFDEIWEFLTVLISNWFIIAMVYNYMIKSYFYRRSRSSPLISAAFRFTLWLRRKMTKYTDIRLKQFSLMSNHRGPPLIAALVPGTLYLNVKSVPLMTFLKLSIGKRLAQHCRGAPLTNGPFSLFNHTDDGHTLLWACESESVTEVIIRWHIATCIAEVYHLPSRTSPEKDLAAAAVSLSMYCAYLVAFHPELLPDRRAKTEVTLKQAKEALRERLGFSGYYFYTPRARAQKLLDSAVPSDHIGAVRLWKQLDPIFKEKENSGQTGWEMLADFWTELLLYAAPAAASDEERLKGHARMS